MKTYQKFLSILLVVVMASSIVFADDSRFTNHFKKVNTYSNGQFSDISESAWYYDNVKEAYEYGLFNGKGEGIFDPDGNLTCAEALKLVAVLRDIYDGTGYDFSAASGEDWYQPYMDYALEKGIIDEPIKYPNNPIVRVMFAKIFGKAFGNGELQNINLIADGEIPDVDVDSEGAVYIYTLYRAGVLTGSDEMGSLKPGDEISRAEVATIVTRIANPLNRILFYLGTDNEAVIDQSEYYYFYAVPESLVMTTTKLGFIDLYMSTNSEAIVGTPKAVLVSGDDANIKVEFSAEPESSTEYFATAVVNAKAPGNYVFDIYFYDVDGVEIGDPIEVVVEALADVPLYKATDVPDFGQLFSCTPEKNSTLSHYVYLYESTSMLFYDQRENYESFLNDAGYLRSSDADQSIFQKLDNSGSVIRTIRLTTECVAESEEYDQYYFHIDIE